MGHSDSELKRLIWQGELLRANTERLLEMAQISRGMRVLDVGCGAGGVALMAAELVGPSGSVIGVDRSAKALAVAETRAEAAGLSWVTFTQASLEELTADESFDAVVGRYVLFHQTDPVGFLRAAGRHIGRSGVIAFHEPNMARPAPSVPEVPLWRQVDEWCKQALTSVAPHADAGSRMVELFSAAGLAEPDVRCLVDVGGGRGSLFYKYHAEATRSLLPLLVKLGVPAEVIGVDTLEDRLRDAVVNARAQIDMNPQCLAVARSER
jgi:ubiquinone/menaquinone biosynthesis C-methylase UbiE